MTSIVQEFIDSLGEPVYSFPPGLRETYSEMIADFRSRDSIKGFERLGTRRGFDLPTPRGVAYRMYRWFPTHFFKFQKSLLLWEEKCRTSEKPFLLGRPKVTFVDLGCGAGAASAAVLALLEQYQHFRKTKNLLSNPIEVRFVGLDPVPAELDAYETLIQSYADRVRQQRISVRFQTLQGEFPAQTPRLASVLSRLQGHTILVGMSNLIYWIWQEYDEYLKQGELLEVARVSPQEVKALRQLTEQVDYDYFHVIGIAVRKGRFAFLPQKLKRFFLRLLSAFKLAERPFGSRWGALVDIVFENPEGSHWVTNRPRGDSHYYVENLVDADPHYVQDNRIHKVLSLDSLETAWAKIRCYMRYESLTDEVELKLFENDLRVNLVGLRECALDRCFDRLNIQQHLPYEFPKNPRRTRPRSLARIEDQILAAAVCVNSQEELEGPCPEVSYSYRLAPRKSEFLYEYWFAAYREYLGDVLRSFNGGQVFMTDMKSYYTHIRQSLLLDIVQKRLDTSQKCCEMLTPVIRRDCRGQHSTGCGLLQGHALSGLFSNVMLQPVDFALVSGSGLKGRYFRFTDDIIVTGRTGPTSSTDTLIQAQLSSHDESEHLILNDQKTRYFAEDDFKRRVSGYKKFDSLGKRFRALLLPVFLMNIGYRREFGRTEWSFIHEYRRMLERVGIHFSAEWLYRKIDEYGKPHRWMRSIRRKWRLSWPSLSLAKSSSGVRSWEHEFASSNSEWMIEKRQLKQEFTRMFVKSSRELIAGDVSDSVSVRRRRAVKFALYRLSVLDVSSVCDRIVELLSSQPWNIPVCIACRALARANCVEALEKVVRQSSSSYVRAIALRALGKIRTDEAVSLLVTVLDDHAAKIERLMASEALLDANLWHNIEIDTIQGWLQTESDHPYVRKNVILILGQAYPNESRALLREMDNKRMHAVVHRAIHYVLNKPVAENLLWKPEPEVLKKYRAKFYPTIEELLGDEGSYILVSS